MKKDLNWGNPTLIMHTCAKTPEFNFSFGYSVCILCIWQRRGTVAEFGVLEPTYRILIKLDWTFDFWWTTTYEQITPSVVFLEANRKIVCDISRKIHHLYSSVASILVSCTHETVSIRKGNRWKKATSISKLMLCWNTKSSRDFNSFPEKVYMHIPPLTHLSFQIKCIIRRYSDRGYWNFPDFDIQLICNSWGTNNNPSNNLENSIRTGNGVDFSWQFRILLLPIFIHFLIAFFTIWNHSVRELWTEHIVTKWLPSPRPHPQPPKLQEVSSNSSKQKVAKKVEAAKTWQRPLKAFHIWNLRIQMSFLTCPTMSVIESLKFLKCMKLMWGQLQCTQK